MPDSASSVKHSEKEAILLHQPPYVEQSSEVHDWGCDFAPGRSHSGTQGSLSERTGH